jgi:hypothetical protein
MTPEQRAREERYLQKGLKELESVSGGLLYGILNNFAPSFSILPIFNEKSPSDGNKHSPYNPKARWIT